MVSAVVSLTIRYGEELNQLIDILTHWKLFYNLVARPLKYLDIVLEVCAHSADLTRPLRTQ